MVLHTEVADDDLTRRVVTAVNTEDITVDRNIAVVVTNVYVLTLRLIKSFCILRQRSLDREAL